MHGYGMPLILTLFENESPTGILLKFGTCVKNKFYYQCNGYFQTVTESTMKSH